LSEQLAYHETLTTTKDNIDSPEYIEEIAREKLDMYFPNETVYIDKSK
jgi:cell division protein FtsB